ncbi:hypothetical protein [Mucilaginibacter sp.]|uniref:hypothetical protein n=1 Tax=Mucilaginibacter sp. TaxID=1882438 RepID=UPI0026149167|nr:hypothetical protein [Mucilaginibacter sp.]MDB4924896.1 hypothetical protein [Mucilaginibacter sp.]
MTFEEFFTKKRIDLAAFKQAEPGLFSEFKTHFEQMGEKSFDHTKKYWFNKIRRQYNLPPEVKTEKPRIENQLAEQTVTESLDELATATPKVGFTPRFKAAVPPKPAETPAEEQKEEIPVSDKPKVGFTPRFKAGVTKPAETPAEEKKEEAPAPVEPKVGFTPRFKAGVTKPAEAAAPEEKKEETPVEDKPKIGFTPRFKAGVTKPAPPKSPEE